MKNARWRSACSPVWPPEAIDWLTTAGSLTLRLQRSFGQFKVMRLHQGMAPALSDEYGALGLRSRRQVRSRDVCLWAGERPRVLAHSVVSWQGPACDWPFWRQLGSRSLGSLLFRDHQVRRLRMQFARLPDRHPLAKAAVRTLAAQGHAPPARSLHARRAVYVRAARRTPLLVTEVFLNLNPGQARRSSWKG